jgi:hypothetical protein
MFAKRLVRVTIATIALSLAATAQVKAQPLQGEKISIGAAGSAQHVDVRGYTKGSVAFFKTLGDRDRAQNRCMGYGSLVPDHTLEIQKRTAEVTLQVKTQGQDTTLVVAGPDNRLYCADDSLTGGKDAGLVLKNLGTGTYKIWVGTFDPGEGTRYQLSIQSQ